MQVNITDIVAESLYLHCLFTLLPDSDNMKITKSSWMVPRPFLPPGRQVPSLQRVRISPSVPLGRPLRGDQWLPALPAHYVQLDIEICKCIITQQQTERDKVKLNRCNNVMTFSPASDSYLSLCISLNIIFIYTVQIHQHKNNIFFFLHNIEHLIFRISMLNKHPPNNGRCTEEL